MSWKPSDLPDLSGRTAIVTGANSGIGFHTARELAAHGATVFLACRNVDAAREAAAEMTGDLRVERLDLSSQQSVADFAARWERPLDLLVNNAGVMRPPKYGETVDGHELQFGTNHLGHFALTGRLLPALLAAPAPRVVTVSSVAHGDGNISVLDANPEASYRPIRSYGNTKLANLLFALELHRRAPAAESTLTSTAAHPGVAATGLVADPNGMGANPFFRPVGKYVLPLIFASAKAAANPSLYAAVVAEPGSYTGPQWLGEWRGPVGPAKLSYFARDQELARKLWDLSVEKTGVDVPL